MEPVVHGSSMWETTTFTRFCKFGMLLNLPGKGDSFLGPKTNVRKQTVLLTQSN